MAIKEEIRSCDFKRNRTCSSGTIEIEPSARSTEPSAQSTEPRAQSKLPLLLQMQTKQSDDQRLASAKMEHMGQIQREKEAQAQQQMQKQQHMQQQMQKEMEVRDSQLQQLSREIENAMRQNHEMTRRAETAEQVAAEATMRLEKYVADHEDLKHSRDMVRQEREQQGHELQQVSRRRLLATISPREEISYLLNCNRSVMIVDSSS